MSRAAPPEADIDQGGETPRLTIRCGWPRDLLSWVTATPSLLFVGGILGLFAGGGVGVMTQYLFDHGLLAFGAGIVVFALVWMQWAKEHFGVSGETHEFYRDHLISRLRSPWSRRGALETVQIAYDEIGTLRLLRGGRVKVHFGIPSPERRASCLMHLPKLSAADQFDAIVEWIEEARPGHLFLAESSRDRHYSQAWRLQDRFPDLGGATDAVTIDSLHRAGRLEIGDQTFTLTFRGFSEVLVRQGTDPDSAPIMAAISEVAAGAPEIRVLDAGGMLLAMTVNDKPTTWSIAMGFEIDRQLIWDYRDGKIRIDGDVVGGLEPRGINGATLRPTDALPVPVVLIVFLLAGLFRHHLSSQPQEPQTASNRAR